MAQELKSPVGVCLPLGNSAHPVHQQPDEAFSFLEGKLGFTKLDEGILQSSIMAEDPTTFKVWVALMAACKPNGVAPVSPVYIASVCHLKLDDVTKAMKKLSSPDPYSRSKKDDGRRIQEVDHGWRLVNYKYYRRYLYSDSPDALRQRRHREKKRDSRDTSRMSRNERDISASASASASSSSSNISFDLSSLSWCGISDDDVKGWKEAYPACDIKIELAKMKEWVLSNKAKGKKSNWRRFITNWLSRSQDRGGTKKGKQSMADWVKEQEGA